MARKRKDSKSHIGHAIEEKSAPSPSANLKEFVRNILRVLNRPTVAIVVFLIGLPFIVVASKQVRFLLDTMESYNLARRPREGVLTYLLAVLVFLMVWLDVILFMTLKNWSITAYKTLYKWYTDRQLVKGVGAGTAVTSPTVRPARRR